MSFGRRREEEEARERRLSPSVLLTVQKNPKKKEKQDYVEHQKEMGGPALSMPVVFLKPPSCAVFAKKQEGHEELPPLAVVEVPRGRGSCHYETELVLRVAADGKSFDAVTIGLDLTLRDVQNECKKTGHPWESAKVFRGAAVLGDWVPLQASSDPSAYLDFPFEFDLAGHRNVQTGVGSEMMVLPEKALKYVDSLFEVFPGDLFFTGTPAGVGPVVPGQEAEVRLLERKGEGEAKALVQYRVRFE